MISAPAHDGLHDPSCTRELSSGSNTGSAKSTTWAGALINVRLGKIKGAGSQFPVYTYCSDGDAVCQGSSRNYVLNTWEFSWDRVSSDKAVKIHGEYEKYTASAAKLADIAVRDRVTGK